MKRTDLTSPDYHRNGYDLERNVHRITLYNTVSADQQHHDMRERLYLHLDMNCFYAQVEQISYNLFGIPIIVGGWRKEDGTPRGIVATSSYEARAFGIKTGMSAFEAQQICPYVVFMQVHYEKYQAISRQLKTILDNYAMDVEKYSMDEYFLDVTFLLKQRRKEVEQFGIRLKNEVYRKTGLICSVGIAYSKTYAKLASDINKPNGLTLVLDKEEAKEIIFPLELNEVWGIGRRRFAKLQDHGMTTIADAHKRGHVAFQRIFGAYFGKMLYETATGQDHAKVLSHEQHVPKDITYMHTFSDWTNDIDRVKGELTKAVRQVGYRMRGYNKRARDFGGYIRFQDAAWKGVSFKFCTKGYTNLDDYILRAAWQGAEPLLKRFMAEGHTIRGVGIHTIELDQTNQMELFFREDEQVRSKYYAVDNINNRHGLDTIMTASDRYGVVGKTHFLDRNF